MSLKILGLTGNIAAGKTTVSNMLKESGGFVINADEVAHMVVKSGRPAFNEIITAFGDSFIEDGEINRRELGQIVFNDNQKLSKLMEISYKYIIAFHLDEARRISDNPGEYRFIVFDAPMLIEGKLDSHCDQVWVVTAKEALRRERLRARFTEAEIDQRIKAQTSWDELVAKAHVLIENNGSEAELRDFVTRRLNEFLEI